MARTIVIEVESKREIYEANITELEDMYNHIKCDCIDITERKIGENYYDIIVDDEGLLKDYAIPSAIDKITHEVQLVGNLIVSKYDEEGELRDLTEKEIKEVTENIKQLVCFQCDYEQPVLLLGE